jgi:hypothetical protein
LRDDAASHLVYVPEDRRRRDEPPKDPSPPEPDTSGAVG